jgi:hypothetical protein
MRSILIFLAALFSIAGFGQTITTEVIVTNTPASGFNWTFAGSFRYWTNARTATTIDTNTVTDVNYAATNLYTQVALSLYTDPTYGSFRVQRGATNSIKLLGPPGLIPSISQNSNWIRWVFTTNGSQPGTNISIPAVKMYPVAANRTNILGQLQSDIVDYGAAGKLYPTNDARLGNYAGRGNYPQTLLGALTLNQIAGGTNRGTIYGGTNSAETIADSELRRVNIGTNRIDVMQSPIGGIGAIRFYDFTTNGYVELKSYGEDPVPGLFNSTGTFWNATGEVYNASAAILNAGTAILLFPALDGTRFYPYAQVTNTWGSVNLWNHPSNAFNGFVSINGGSLIVSPTITGGGSSNTTVQSFNATNGTFNGTNIFKGSIAYPWYSLSTIGAGNNIAVPLGTNVYIALSGNTGPAALCGFTGGQNGLTYRLLNRSAYAQSLSQSTIDPRPEDRIVGNISGDLSFDPGVWVDIVWDESVSRYRFVVPTAAGTNYVTTGRSDTNLNVWASSSNNVALSVHAFVNQNSNLLEWVDSNTNVLASIGPAGGFHIGGASAAGSSNLVVEGTTVLKGGVQMQSSNNITGTLNVGGAVTLTNLTASRLVATDSAKTLTSTAQSSGQLPIGNGAGGYTLATVTPRNGIAVDNGSGTITIGIGSGALATNLTAQATAGSSSAVALKVIGDSTTATNIFEVQKSTGQIVGSVDSNGLLQALSESIAGIANITGASAFGGVATFSNTVVGQLGANLTGTLNVNAIINTNLGTFMGGVVATNNATTNVTLKIVGMAAVVTNIWEVWSNTVLQVTVSSNGIITFPSSNPVQVYKDSTDSLQLVANLGSGKIVYVGDASAASYGVAVGSSATRIKSGVLALGGANDTNNIRLKQIQAGTTTLPNVLGIQDAAGGAAGCLLEFRAVPDSRTNNAPSTDSARIGAFLDSGGVAQLFVKAEDGTTKQITEHAIADCPPFLLDSIDDMPNVSKEIQPYLGKVRWINRSREALLTQLQFWGTNVNAMPTNKTTFIYVETFQRYNNRLGLTNGNGLIIESWTANQDAQQARYDAARLDELAQQAGGNTNIVVRPVRDVRKAIPAWLAARGAN